MKMRAFPAFLALLFAPVLFGQQSHRNPRTTFYPAKPILPISETPSFRMDTDLVMPLFLEGAHFSSTLFLVNNSIRNTYADVKVRATDGSTVAEQRITFTPHSQRRIPIAELLSEKGSSVTAGSIEVTQSPTLKGPSIAGMLAVTYLGSADPNYMDEEISMPMLTGSEVLEGVVDRANGAPVLALSSMSGYLQHIKVECFGEQGLVAKKQVDLAPGATAIEQTCTAQSVHDGDFHAALEARNESATGPMGIRLTSDAIPGSFAAFAVAPHQKNGVHFFSSVLFTDPKTLNSPNTIFTGIPIGSTMLLPDGRYTPEISLTNFSFQPIHARIAFAHSSNHAAESHEIGSLVIPPGTSREFVPSKLEGDPDLQNSFVIRSDGAPGALMAKLVSTSDSRLPEMELQAKDELDMDNAGNHPWSIEQSTESTLLLFNHSETPQNFDVTIFAEGGIEWQQVFKLAPAETRAVNIRELVDDQVPDAKGRVLPRTAQSGELNWMDVIPKEGSGRLLQTDRASGLARNFSCGYSGLLCGDEFTIMEDQMTDGDTVEFGDQIPVTCTSGQPQFCSGEQTGTGGSFNFSWESGTPAIASVSGESTFDYVNLHGVSGGTSTIQGQIHSESCETGGQGPQKVQVPTSLKLVKAPPTILQQGTGLQHGCPPGYYGIEIDIDYQVLDQSGAPIADATMEPQESIPGMTTGYQDIGPSGSNYPQSLKLTRSDGTFDDVPLGTCPPVPVTTLTSWRTQSIQILYNGTAYPVRTNNWSYSTTNLPNHGTLTNGKDINATQ